MKLSLSCNVRVVSFIEPLAFDVREPMSNLCSFLPINPRFSQIFSHPNQNSPQDANALILHHKPTKGESCPLAVTVPATPITS